MYWKLSHVAGLTDLASKGWTFYSKAPVLSALSYTLVFDYKKLHDISWIWDGF